MGLVTSDPGRDIVVVAASPGGVRFKA